MTLHNYKPLTFEEVEGLPSDYEKLKELCSRGAYWLDSQGNTHSQQEIFSHFGDDVFQKLFCHEFDPSLYDTFCFAKATHDESRLLRDCGRANIIHPLRATKHVKDAGGSLLAQKVTLMHDYIENMWEYFVAVAHLKKFEGKNYQYITSLKFNFINFDLESIDAGELKQRCYDAAHSIEQHFGNEGPLLAFGVNELTNMESIEGKLAFLESGKREDEKREDEKREEEKKKRSAYISELLDKFIACPVPVYADIVMARSGDRIDNMVTSRYMPSGKRLGYTDKSIALLEGSCHVLNELIEQNKFLKLPYEALSNITKKLRWVTINETKENFRLQRKSIKGYRLEYRMDFFASESKKRLKKLREITGAFKEVERKYELAKQLANLGQSGEMPSGGMPSGEEKNN